MGKRTQPELPLSPGNVVNTELPGPEAARAEAECAACGGEWLEAQLKIVERSRGYSVWVMIYPPVN